MRLIPLELQPTNNASRRKAWEAHLIHRGKTLTPDGINRQNERSTILIFCLYTFFFCICLSYHCILHAYDSRNFSSIVFVCFVFMVVLLLFLFLLFLLQSVREKLAYLVNIFLSIPMTGLVQLTQAQFTGMAIYVCVFIHYFIYFKGMFIIIILI